MSHMSHSMSHMSHYMSHKALVIKIAESFFNRRVVTHTFKKNGDEYRLWEEQGYPINRPKIK